MSLLTSPILKLCKQFPEYPVIIAYSGGVDSQVLLHAFASLKAQNKISNTLTVCHVNHGLSKNAELWQSFAKQQADSYLASFVTQSVNVEAKPQQSLEAMAREERYKVLFSVSKTPSIVVTGHHQDDQAETLLLALKRGSGLKGLSGIKALSSWGEHFLARPLLGVSRQEVMDYALTHKLEWVEDESNLDQEFDRNFFRHSILPKLKERWPSILSTMARSAQHCEEQQILVDEIAAEDLEVSQISTKVLSVEKLLTFSNLRFNNLLRYFLSLHRLTMPSSAQVNQVREQLLAKSDKNPAIKLNDYWLRRYKNELHLTDSFKDVSELKLELGCQSEQKNTNASVELPDGLGQVIVSSSNVLEPKESTKLVNWVKEIKAPSNGQKVEIRFKHDNQNCLPDYREKSRSVKKILQELNIPSWQRTRIPFLYYDDVLVSAIGFFVCKPFIANAKNRSVSVMLQTSKENNSEKL